MKKFLLTSVLLSGLTASAETLRSVSQSLALSQLFTVMSDAATGGASLAHFSYTESFIPLRKNCKLVPSMAIRTYVKQNIENMNNEGLIDTGSDNMQEMISDALMDLSTITGNVFYEKCTYSRSEGLTYKSYTEFISGKYQIRFELGFED